MKAYKKRAKQSWHQGKRYKGDGSERQFSQKEIQEHLDSSEEAYLEKYHKGKRTKNLKARLEYRVSYYERMIKDWTARGIEGKFMSWFYEGLREAKKALKDAFPEVSDE